MFSHQRLPELCWPRLSSSPWPPLRKRRNVEAFYCSRTYRSAFRSRGDQEAKALQGVAALGNLLPRRSSQRGRSELRLAPHLRTFRRGRNERGELDGLARIGHLRELATRGAPVRQRSRVSTWLVARPSPDAIAARARIWVQCGPERVAVLPGSCPEGGGRGCRSRLNGVVVDRAYRAEIVAETPGNHEIVMCARPDFDFSASAPAGATEAWQSHVAGSDRGGKRRSNQKTSA